MEFESVIGHERPKKFLRNMLERGRMSHALLFVGPRGVGKATMALGLAKRLFCDQGNACGACRSCVNVDRKSHPDLHIISGEATIGIDDLRELRKQIHEYPYEKAQRIIIIDGAEMMTYDAANALLKSLEEPPPFNLFVLVSHAERELPLTIRSRCVRVAFGPLARGELNTFFRTVEPDPGRAALTASLACGSVALGLFWMQEEHLALRKRLAELVIGGEQRFEILTALSEKVTAEATDIPFYLQFLLSLFRDVWFFTATGDRDGLVNRDLEDMLGQSGRGDTWLQASVQAVQETMRAMRYNIGKWLAFEHMMLSIARSR